MHCMIRFERKESGCLQDWREREAKWGNKREGERTRGGDKAVRTLQNKLKAEGKEATREGG